MCNKPIPITEYRNHIGGCFNFDKEINVCKTRRTWQSYGFLQLQQPIAKGVLLCMPTQNALLINNDEPGILQKHEPTSAAFYFVNTFNPKTNQTWSYVGKDCFSKLITDLNKFAQECIKEMNNITQHMKIK